jgi:hypothetical protein
MDNYLTFCVKYLDFIRQNIHDNLKNTAHAPSVQLQDVPLSFFDDDSHANEIPSDICADNLLINNEK